jgi:hypothetical protein
MSTLDAEAAAIAPIVVNGQHFPGTATAVKANAPAATAYTFSSNYAHSIRGQHLTYRKGLTYILSLEVKAILLALSAPMVAA